MGIMDKIKNIFAEEVEEEDEIKVEQIKKEVKVVPIESPNMERRAPSEISAFDGAVAEAEQGTEKAKTPVFFTDRDFADLIAPKKRTEKYGKKLEPVKEEVKDSTPKPYGGHYSSTTIVKKERPNFKPTPIISPVYGVLDKNYHKDDIVDKNDQPKQYISVDGLSVDNIRNKAYGTLEDDLGDVVAYQQTNAHEAEDDNIDLFEELEDADTAEIEVPIVQNKPEKNVRQIEGVTIDLTKELDNLLMKRERFSEKSNDEKEVDAGEQEALTESELFDLIDSMYEEGDEEK